MGDYANRKGDGMDDHDATSIERDIRERVEASPFHASLGISVESADEGAVDLRFEATPAHANLQGTVHGGVHRDPRRHRRGTGGANGDGRPGRRHVSVHLDVQYLAPADIGTLRATGRVVKRRGPRSRSPRPTMADEAGDCSRGRR